MSRRVKLRAIAFIVVGSTIYIGWRTVDQVSHSSAVAALYVYLPRKLIDYYRANGKYPDDLEALPIEYEILDGASPYCLKWLSYASTGQSFVLEIKGRSRIRCIANECERVE